MAQSSASVKTIETHTGTWKGMDVGFDFQRNPKGPVTHCFEANWNIWPTREACLDHFRRKTWVTAADLDALGQLWDDFVK